MENGSLIRVKIGESRESVDFRVTDSFQITDADGRVVIEHCDFKDPWRVKVDDLEIPELQYQFYLPPVIDESKAEELVAKFAERGYTCRMIENNRQKMVQGSEQFHQQSWQVVIDGSDTLMDARKLHNQYFYQYGAKIVEYTKSHPEVTFEVFDEAYRQVAKIQGNVLLKLKDPQSTVTLFDLVVGDGFHWERRTKKQFSGDILFAMNQRGTIDIIVEMPFEAYLKGVVPAEMGYHYPLEALKAQAIVSRTWALKHLDFQHPNEPFDVCCDRHCQLFYTQMQADNACVEAVESTKGQVMVHHNALVQAEFHTLCGGQTEQIESLDFTILDRDNPGIYDAQDAQHPSLDLSSEESVTRWIKDTPDVYCNLKTTMDHSKLDVTKLYFRWEITYSRKELEEIIKSKIKRNIGILYDILPTIRAKSGHLKEIELLCSNLNVKIRGEFNIRKILSEKTLNSSCFIIQTELDTNGIPISFTLTGAGSGHGMGLCQTGAAVMAMEGKRHSDILSHYFPNSQIKRCR